jgi:predicted component of type VI protein secretion system
VKELEYMLSKQRQEIMAEIEAAIQESLKELKEAAKAEEKNR